MASNGMLEQLEHAGKKECATPLKKKTIVTFDYFYVRNWTMSHQRKKRQGFHGCLNLFSDILSNAPRLVADSSPNPCPTSTPYK